MGNSHSANPQRHLTTQRQRPAVDSRHVPLVSHTLDPFHANEMSNGDSSPAAYASNMGATQDEEKIAYDAFLKMFPEYRRTWIMDTLRRTDFARLDSTGETYVDYMGGSLYPESLIRVHTAFLNTHVLGNTHSVSNR
jgi:molybdenum cofactor sulfurtransferase